MLRALPPVGTALPHKPMNPQAETRGGVLTTVDVPGAVSAGLSHTFWQTAVMAFPPAQCSGARARKDSD